MKKETIAMKLAKKSFESDAIQKSWKMHVQVFGKILEPAFIDDYQTRIHLTAALNHISNRKVKEGFKKLEFVEKACVTDEDYTAYFFCMGLGFEMANMVEEMVACYQKTAEYGHDFYWTYLKVAKAAYNDGVYEVAKENFEQAIKCLKKDNLDEQKTILASAYTNYASCLTMMHHYNEAESALHHSYDILPVQQGRKSIEAILEAAKGNNDNANLILEKIKQEETFLYDATIKTVNDIVTKQHPHFFSINIPEENINGFWNWFVDNEEKVIQLIKNEKYDVVFEMMQMQLRKVFLFAENNIELGIEPQGSYYNIIFVDFFMISLQEGYKKLIDTQPESLLQHWKFDITH